MRNPTPLPMPVIDTTVHATARNTARRALGIVIEDAQHFTSAQEHLELLIVMRDYCNAGIANIEGLAAGAPAAAGARASL